MKKPAAHLVGLALMAQPFISPPAQAEPPAGRLLASQCAQCHGTNGVAVSGMDSLAGKSSSDIVGDVGEMQFKDPSEIMHRQARGYTQDQLQRIGSYFSSLPGGSD